MFNMLSVPIRENSVSLHLFQSSKNLFHYIFFSEYKFYAQFVRLLPKDFCFWGYCKWYYLLTSASNCLLLVYRSTIDYFKLNLYPETL